MRHHAVRGRCLLGVAVLLAATTTTAPRGAEEPKGEWYAPTQPVPTKPPAYDQQGAAIDDVIDFTPELRQEAVKILSQYRYGPLFTPPSVAGGPDGKKGTVQMPGAVGGSNWTGAGVDPETGILYVTFGEALGRKTRERFASSVICVGDRV